MEKQRRPLTEDEKTIVTKSLKLLQAETEDATYMVDYCDLMLDRGLDINFSRQRREFEGKKKDAQNAISVNNETVKLLEQQLTEGVEVKEESTDETN